MKILNYLKRIPFEIRYIFVLFISTRIVLTIIGSLSHTFIDKQYGKQYSWSKYVFFDIWGVWDSFWYVDIATNGYSPIGSNPLSPNQTNLAFFPLYPLLMNLLGRVTGGEYFLSGILISNVCLLISGFLLYQIVKAESTQRTALNAVKYLFLFPVAFIYSGVFTESLYLCITLLCFYMAKKQNWLLVGIIGACLALTRSLGVFIILPLLHEYLSSIKFNLNKIRPNICYLLIIPLGLLIFAGYNYYITDNFFFFANNQSAWQRKLINPAQALWKGFSSGVFEPNPKKFLEFIFSFVSLSLLGIFYRKIRFSYWLFGMYSIFIPLTAGIDSMARYVLPIFPLYIICAELGKKRYVDQGLTLFLGMLQGCLMVFWSIGFALVV
jgi:hypothetical protein